VHMRAEIALTRGGGGPSKKEFPLGGRSGSVGWSAMVCQVAEEGRTLDCRPLHWSAGPAPGGFLGSGKDRQKEGGQEDRKSKLEKPRREKGGPGESRPRDGKDVDARTKNPGFSRKHDVRKPRAEPKKRRRLRHQKGVLVDVGRRREPSGKMLPSV